MVQCEINEYFARHPEMMLGRMGMESGQYGMAPALIGNSGARRSRKGRFTSSRRRVQEQGQPGSVVGRGTPIKFPRSAKSKKAGWPIATARSSFAAATRSSL